MVDMQFVIAMIFSMMVGSFVASGVGAGGYFHARCVVTFGMLGSTLYVLLKAVVVTIVAVITFIASLFIKKD